MVCGTVLTSDLSRKAHHAYSNYVNESFAFRSPVLGKAIYQDRLVFNLLIRRVICRCTYVMSAHAQDRLPVPQRVPIEFDK